MGPISSGGGMVVVCDQGNNQQTVELLEYYESRVLYGDNVVAKATGDLTEDYYQLAKRTYALQGYPEMEPVNMEKHVNHFLGKIDWVQPHSLPFLNDHGPTVDITENCQIKQLAIFYDTKQRISVVKELWEQMDSMNQAALITHEIYYFYERKFAEMTSSSTRSFVRQILTSEVQQPVYFASEGAIARCTTKRSKSYPMLGQSHDFEFLVIQKDGKTVLQFNTFGVRAFITRTIASYDGELLFKSSLNNGEGDQERKQFAGYGKLVPLKTTQRADLQVLLNISEHGTLTIQGYRNGSPLTDTFVVNCSSR